VPASIAEDYLSYPVAKYNWDHAFKFLHKEILSNDEDVFWSFDVKFKEFEVYSVRVLGG